MVPVPIVSFSSPKGGTGRTLVAANVASILARGCAWAGLHSATVLVIDLDLRAPGLHYYMGNLARRTPGAVLRWRGRQLTATAEALCESIIGNDVPVGMLAWLTAHVCPDEDAQHVRTAYASLAEELDACWERRNVDPRSPFYHLYELDLGTASILFVPAGDPGHPTFTMDSLTFSDADFFDPSAYDGVQVLATFYEHLVRRWTELRPDRPITSVLLDQDAGRSPRAAVNIGQASRNVFVSKLDRQSRSGLRSLVESEVKFDSSEQRPQLDMRVVLSQYAGRPHATAARWHNDANVTFLAEDAPRREIVDELKGLGIDPRWQVFLVDFYREAVQREFFLPEPSPSYDEMVRLAVSLVSAGEHDERSDRVTTTHGQQERPPRVRVLGEYIDGSTGSLEAFAKWAKRHQMDVEVTGMSHEDIVELVERGSTDATNRWTGRFAPPNDDRAGEESLSFGRERICLSDFDIVALPTYARTLCNSRFEDLAGPSECAPLAQDCVGGVTNEYLEASVLGWSEFATTRDGRLLGYPLFVDCLLLVVNPKTVNSTFFQEFNRREERLFRGLNDPADFRDLVRAAAENSQDYDCLIMTLKSGALAAWYEWIAIVAIFDGELSLSVLRSVVQEVTPAKRIETFLTDTRVIHATARYLELTLYADRQSKGAGWPDALALIAKGEVGMALVWPDARPTATTEERLKETQTVSRGAETDFNGVLGLTTSDGPSRSASVTELRYAVPPGGSVTECWLLCVPRDRKGDRPKTAELEYLLQQFLTYEEQRLLVQKYGGLPVHRRVLADVSLWRESPHLPLLNGVFTWQQATESRLCHGPADFWVRPLSQRLLRELEELRWDVDQMIKDELRSRPADDPGPFSAHLWHDKNFVGKVETLVGERFSACAARLADEVKGLIGEVEGHHEHAG